MTDEDLQHEAGLVLAINLITHHYGRAEPGLGPGRASLMMSTLPDIDARNFSFLQLIAQAGP